MEAQRFAYLFGANRNEGNRTMRQLLGGKGANLAEMASLGLPVPPGFTITTATCDAYYKAGEQWPEGLNDDVERGIRHLEEAMDRKLGDARRPLLVSVRSGAAVSMPGMMDTVLNLGMNDAVAEAIALETGDDRFAFDAYRRFIDMFGDVVMGVRHEHFEEAIERLKKERGVKLDNHLSATDLRELVDRYKAIYRRHTGYMFPEDPREQLKFAINAVFASWHSDRAAKYRQINGIKGLIGTAVNVQVMVFGNRGDTSGTGVLFSRNPATGEPVLYGEFLVNAQGEDVVAGIRTPEPLDHMAEVFPPAYLELKAIVKRLEAHYGDMQDIEFTVEDEKLYILQARSGKRTGTAAFRIAADMVREGMVTKERAIRDLLEPRHVEQLLHKQFADVQGYKSRVIATGLPASPGAAVGRVVFTAPEAEAQRAKGERVILVRVETSPEDVGGMHAAEGILTSRGGMTSHAAVVARGWGKPCVAGCGEIIINESTKSFTNGEVTVHEGDWISLNGSSGEVVFSKEELVMPKLTGDFDSVMQWADSFRTLHIRANADTPEDAQRARAFGAEGIGLARTEHMFFENGRIETMRAMILANTPEERRKALEQLLPMQRGDFKGLFRAMGGYPVTVRFLDPPLHEFLPHGEEEVAHLAEVLGLSLTAIKRRIKALREMNPMLGHRGCRLGITHPEITEMQTRAVLEAAAQLQAEGVQVEPEIMIPLVGTLNEFQNQKAVIMRVASQIEEELGLKVSFKVGTMIEVPRAAIMAGQLATEAEFFSFGTNDLTQLTFGYSRDDAEASFLPVYLNQGILSEDPFETLDPHGVGALVEMGTTRGRETRPDLHVGICGEHGGDPASIHFCHATGLNYVSCSPFRLPVARLAAAQAALKAKQ